MVTIEAIKAEIARLEREQKLISKRLVKYKEFAATFAPAVAPKPKINPVKTPDAVAVSPNAQ
jgi:hypothetical protein